MKKFLMLAVAAIAALASCARFETTDHSAQQGEQPIGFSSYTPKPLNKAGDTFVSENTLVSDKQFAVYAWKTAYGSFLEVNPGVPDFMNPAVVTWNNDGNSGSGNSYSPTRYWPAGDEPENLSFTAYYPYGGAGITPPTFGSGTDPDPFVPSGVGSYGFTVQDESKYMVDFCVADVVNDQVYGATNKTAAGHKGTVSFSFKHQLTKVQFKFKKSTGLSNTTVIELVDAKLAGIKNSGTLNATFARHTEDTDNNTSTPEEVVTGVNKLGTTTTSWIGQTGSGGFDITVNQADPEDGSAIVLTETASTVHNKDIFLMIPQDMDASTQAIVVTWKVKVYDTEAHATANDGTGLGSETTNTKTLYFYSDLVMGTYDDDNDPNTPEIPYSKDWEKNSSITYTITIGPSPIYFTGTVANWDGEQNGYINVN